MICDELLTLSGYAIALGDARLLLSSSSALLFCMMIYFNVNCSYTIKLINSNTIFII